ncbi:hypothetical protein [Paenibacillus sp. FSL K6-2862]|uniref:hypothetical protein n=1 Tax=Paenibacillus sp. FSL K6-2862 TaxID=2921484 RepID=UPI0030F95178
MLNEGAIHVESTIHIFQGRLVRPVETHHALRLFKNIRRPKAGAKRWRSAIRARRSTTPMLRMVV